MKTQTVTRSWKGFTLIELMVAMSVTTMIVLVLVSITSIALDTWTRSRSEVRAARQAKSMADTMARDLESLVSRRGTNVQWLSAEVNGVRAEGKGPSIENSNASEIVFFAAPTDRYKGDLSGTGSIGNVSCVGYQLKYQDPIQAKSGEDIPTFVLYRLLVDPKDAYDKLLSKASTTGADLKSEFELGFRSDIDKTDNFVCENVFQYTLTMNLSVTKAGSAGTPTTRFMVPVILSNEGGSATEFKVIGSSIETDFSSPDLTAAQLKEATLESVEISLTVLTDFGIEQMRKRRFGTPAEEAAFLAKNSYQYTKLVAVPGL